MEKRARPTTKRMNRVSLSLFFSSVVFIRSSRATLVLRANGPRVLLLSVLFFLVVAQSLLAVAQFAAETPFHPWPDLSRHMALPRGDATGWRAGWLSGTFASRTALAGALEVTTFLSLGLLVWGRGGAAVKLLLLWVTAAGFAGLSLSLSRSAYLGVPAGVAVFALLSFFLVRRGAVAHRGWLMAGTLLLVVLSLGLGLAAGAESFAVRMRLTELRLDEYREKLWFFTVPPMLGIDPLFAAAQPGFGPLALELLQNVLHVCPARSARFNLLSSRCRLRQIPRLAR